MYIMNKKSQRTLRKVLIGEHCANCYYKHCQEGEVPTNTGQEEPKMKFNRQSIMRRAHEIRKTNDPKPTMGDALRAAWAEAKAAVDTTAERLDKTANEYWTLRAKIAALELELKIREDELKAACNESAELQWKTLIHFLLASGCRRGEACALRWSRIDFETGSVTVSASITPIAGRGNVEGPTKSGKARRVILPDEVLEMLKAHRDEQETLRLAIGDAWVSAGDYVFTRRNGLPMSPAYVSIWIPRFAERHGLKRIVKSFLICSQIVHIWDKANAGDLASSLRRMV